MLGSVYFIIFSLITLLCATFVISTKNPIHSVLFLVLVFFNTAILLILLGVEFLAFLFLIVYVGAIAVLFLFVIMMLTIKISDYKTMIYQYFPIGVVLGLGFLFELFIIFESALLKFLIIPPFENLHFNDFHLNFLTVWGFNLIKINNIDVFASCLYTYFAYLFILSGIILLVSMVGAITLTLHKSCDIKRQQVYRQIINSSIY